MGALKCLLFFMCVISICPSINSYPKNRSFEDKYEINRQIKKPIRSNFTPHNSESLSDVNVLTNYKNSLEERALSRVRSIKDDDGFKTETTVQHIIVFPENCPEGYTKDHDGICREEW